MAVAEPMTGRGGSRERSRLVWIDVLRGLAVLMVVLHHAEGQIRPNLDDYPRALMVLNDLATPFRMPVLMFLSGLLLPSSMRKPLRPYVAGKMRNIAWPYLVWSFVMLGLVALTSGLTGNRTVTAGSFARVFYDPPTYMWYLAFLLVFYLAARVLPARVRELLVPVALVASPMVDHAYLSRMLFLVAFFLLGDAVMRHWALFERLTRLRRVRLGSAVLAASAAVMSAVGGVQINYSSAWAVPIAAVIPVAIAAATAVAGTPVGRVLAREGAQSIVYYTTHYVFLIVSFNVLVRVGITDAALLSVVLPVLTVLVGMAAVRLRAVPAVDALFEWPRRGARSGLRLRRRRSGSVRGPAAGVLPVAS